MPRKADPEKPKKPKRGFMDGYRKYDTSTGFGSVAEWRDLFADMTGEQAEAIIETQKNTPLGIFGLSVLPETEDDLKKVYRQLMLKHHPDRGGDNDVAKLITAAYKMLSGQIARRDQR